MHIYHRNFGYIAAKKMDHKTPSMSLNVPQLQQLTFHSVRLQLDYKLWAIVWLTFSLELLSVSFPYSLTVTLSISTFSVCVLICSWTQLCVSVSTQTEGSYLRNWIRIYCSASCGCFGPDLVQHMWWGVLTQSLLNFKPVFFFFPSAPAHNGYLSAAQRWH